MISEREELIKEARELGLDFPKTIKNTALADLIKSSRTEVVDPASEPVEIPEESAEPTSEVIPGSRAYIVAAKKKAFKTRVVSITNKDPRDSSLTSSVFLSFENQHFSLAKRVPLDIPVELEQGLINVAKSVNMVLHKDEVVNGQSTGNKVPVSVKKYTISYGEQ